MTVVASAHFPSSLTACSIPRAFPMAMVHLGVVQRQTLMSTGSMVAALVSYCSQIPYALAELFVFPFPCPTLRRAWNAHGPRHAPVPCVLT
jgi:hypothetical protein